MRAVLAGCGTRGDIQPLLSLAMGLHRRGHEATVAGPPDFEEWARGLGVSYLSMGERMDAYLARISDKNAELVVRKALASMPLLLRSHYAPLGPLVETADVVVAASLAIAPLDLAERFGKRCHYLAYCPQAIPSGEHPMPFLPHFGLPAWLNRFTYWFGAKGHDFNIRRHLDDERARLGLGKSGETWDHILFQNLVVASEPELAPLPGDVRAGRWVRQPGAFFLEDSAPLPEALAMFLTAGDAPLYVGFGSMPDAAFEKTEAWVRQVARTLGMRVVLAGPGTASDSAVLHVSAVNHRLLFPRCAAIVHHGGAGTTAQAARAGVPQVFAPHVTDQFFWAHRARRLGITGPQVNPRRRDARALVAALQSALQPKVRERAGALAARIDGQGVARMVSLLEQPLS